MSVGWHVLCRDTVYDGRKPMTHNNTTTNGGGDNRFVLVSLVAVTTALFVCYSGGGDIRLFVTGGGDNGWR